MSQNNIAEAEAQRCELTGRALAGDEIIIARDHTPLVRLVPVKTPGGRRQPGSGKGVLLWTAPDFDDLPADFADYTRSTDS